MGNKSIVAAFPSERSHSHGSDTPPANAPSALDLQLYEAVHFGHVEIVQQLIDRGAKPCLEVCNSDPGKAVDVFTAATTRATRASDHDLEQLTKRVLAVIREGCKDFMVFPHGVQTLVEEYCVFGRLDSLRWLYQGGLTPLVKVRSAIFDALDAGDAEAVEIMLHYEGPSIVLQKAPDGYSERTMTTLHFATRVHRYSKGHEWTNDLRCVQLLLEAKADATEPGLLDHAFCNYQHDVVLALSRAGATKFLNTDFNPLWHIVSKHDLTENQMMEAVQCLSDQGLLQKEHHNFEGLGQNPMCRPIRVPPNAIEYATEANQPRLVALLRSLP